MKQLNCEICGSTGLVKQDGMFVCQSCGTKYSTEEAKKLMIEGTVEVTGTVKVDTSDELSNLYQIARRAKNDNNSENAAKYYDMILVKDPMSWEASFYVVYFKAMGCTIAQIQSAGQSVKNCIDSVLRLIKDYVDEEESQAKAIADVALHCTLISDMLYNATVNNYNNNKFGSRRVQSNFLTEVIIDCLITADIMGTLGDKVDFLFRGYEEFHSIATSAWKNCITKCHKILLLGAGSPSKAHFKSIEVIEEYTAKVQKYDRNYKSPI